MAPPAPLRVVLLLSLASALVVSGAWLATSDGSPPSTSSLRAGELIKYHGTAARGVLPLGPERLPGAPASFRKYVKKELHRVWDLLGHYPNCRTSPEIFVHAIRTDGFAHGRRDHPAAGAHCDGRRRRRLHLGGPPGASGKR